MGVARKELIAAGMIACRQRLERSGFRHHEAEIFTLPLAPRIWGWVGLGRGVHNGNGSMAITPHIGLLHQDVEQLVARCADWPYHQYSPATIQTVVGMLAPEVTTTSPIYFYPDEPLDEPADHVCRPIEVYGLPWMREYASLAGILALDGDKRYRTALLRWRRAVIEYMLGRPDRARQLLSADLIFPEGPSHRFARALEAQMAHGPWQP